MPPVGFRELFHTRDAMVEGRISDGACGFSDVERSGEQSKGAEHFL
jgi:hypothetical protein